MSVTADLYVADPDTALLTYTALQLFSDSSPNGTFSTQVGSDETIVSGTNNYAITDASGTANTWYRWNYSGVGVTSDSSEPFRASGTTLKRLRMEAARNAGAGYESTCSDAGTTTTLVDAKLGDSGVDTAFLEGAWIYRPDATVTTDKVRRVKVAGFSTDAPTSLAVARAWANAPTSGESYQIFNLQPPIDWPGEPYSWDRAIREGLREVWFVDRLNLGLGTSTNQQRYSLAAFGDLGEPSIRRVLSETEDSNGNLFDVDYSTLGRYWNPVEVNGTVSIDLWPAPATTQSVIAEVVRRDAALFNDTDVTMVDFEVAWRAGVWALYRRINGVLQPGKYAAEQMAAEADFSREYERIQPRDMVSGI